MATDSNKLSIGTLIAAADLSSHLFRAVRVTAAGSVNKVTLASQPVAGILQNRPTTGLACEIAYAGEVKWEAGATFSAGVELMCDTSGRCITAATTANRVVGIALTDGVVGVMASVLLLSPRTID